MKRQSQDIGSKRACFDNARQRKDGTGFGLPVLAVEHAGVATRLREELTQASVEPPPAHFRGAFAFDTQAEMRAALSRAFQLARSLPTFPLSQYAAEIANLGDTEVARIVKERVGQSYFRRALVDYWNGRCSLTGISDDALLRASHIVPWAECRSDDERLDVFNGLLLAAHWDAGPTARQIARSTGNL